jgi:two-component system sensor histidine kinase/response regulator
VQISNSFYLYKVNEELSYDELLKKYQEAKELIEEKDKEIKELKNSTGLFGADNTFNTAISLFADLLPLVITLIDLEGNCVYLNQFGLSLSGYTSKDVEQGLHVKDILVNESDYQVFLDRVDSPYQKVGIPSGDEYLIKNKKGEKFYMLIFSQVIIVPQKGPLVMGVLVDHSNYRKVSDEYIKAEQKLREINAAKDKFFSIIAHDLKSPFNAILGFADLLLTDFEKVTTEQFKNYVSIIHKSAGKGLILLENLLKWSLSQTNKIKFKKSNFDLSELLFENIDFIGEKAAIKGIDIDCVCDEKIEVDADKNMIDTVLRNLLSNAVKFTRANGKVVVTVKIIGKKKKTEPSKVHVTVADNGIGIEEKNLKKLFRIDGQFTTQGKAFEQGTGLGLILCNEFINKHEGEIWVDSVVGQGSQFHFTLPLEKTETK